MNSLIYDQVWNQLTNSERQSVLGYVKKRILWYHSLDRLSFLMQQDQKTEDKVSIASGPTKPRLSAMDRYNQVLHFSRLYNYNLPIEMDELKSLLPTDPCENSHCRNLKTLFVSKGAQSTYSGSGDIDTKYQSALSSY